ncbi:MAG: TonB-dependent receptor plug domain-containing protein [Puniceicoccaceae bacterium]
MKKHYRLLWLTLPLACIPFTGTYAQDTEDEDVYDLSPFVVTGDDDIGYQATSTLAGTRLKTSLRDIGTPISIVNEELLRDTGATDLEDVLVLTPNSEVAGLGGNFTASQYAGSGNIIPEGSRDNPSGGFTRVRGLATADLTRNLFQTNVPFDTYNTDRVDVQRGPNSALFGLGSPGGIVNASTVRANFLKNAGRFRLEADQYGTMRGSFRYNLVPIEDRLAIFVAGLHESTQYEQKQAYQDDERIYLSGLLKITDNIRVHASVESGKIRSTKPDFFPPNDGISPWLLSGKPTVANPADGAVLFRGTDDFFPPAASNSTNSRLLGLNGASSGYIYYYHDTNNPDPTFLGQGFIRANRGTPGNVEYMMVRPRGMIRTMKITGGYFPGDTTQSVPSNEVGFWSRGNVDYQILDRSIFDYRKNLFSSASSQGVDFTVIEGSIEGNWLDGRLGIELAAYDEDFSSWGNNMLQGIEQRAIYIDMNQSLMAQDAAGNWLPNPNFGQPTMGGQYGGNDLYTERQTLRAVVYGEVEAADFLDEDSLLARILGRFRGTGVYTDREIESGQAYDGEGGVNAEMVADALSGGDASQGTWIHRADFRKGMNFALPHVGTGSYDLLGANTLDDLKGINIRAVPFGRQRDRPISPATFVGWDRVNNRFKSFETEVYRLRENDNYWTTFFTDKKGTEIESKVLLGQWWIWDDTVVLTGSWRNDVAHEGSVSAPNIVVPNAAGDPSTLNRPRNTRDPAFVAGPKNLTKTQDKDAKSWSIVVHTPEFIRKHLPWGTEISLFRSKSDNFSLGSSNVNIFNEPTPPEGGVTTEEGFMVSTMNGKLNARVNWFETTATNDRVENSSVNTYATLLVSLVEQTADPNNIANGWTVADAQAVLPPQGVQDVSGFQADWASATASEARSSNDTATQDYTAEGVEIEISYNPTPQWTLLLTLAQQETVTSNVYPVVNGFVDDFVIPTWVNSAFGQSYILNPDNGETLAERAERTIVEPARQAASLAGLPGYEQREWRINFNTSYNFGRDSGLIPEWLGDFTVGAGIRYQDKMGIGFGLYTNPLGNTAFNPDDPYYAPSQTFVDLFFRSEYRLSDRSDLILQLNIKDLTDHDGLYPFYAQPDGSKLYRILEGRLVTVSGTITF